MENRDRQVDERVREIKSRIGELGVTISAVARKAEIAPPHLSAALNGRNYLGIERAERISRALDEIELAQEQGLPTITIPAQQVPIQPQVKRPDHYHPSHQHSKSGDDDE